MIRFRFFIHLSLCLAILSATISPACAFISGQGGDWIEICSGMNNIKIQSENTSEAPDMSQSGCEFCFQFFKVMGVESASLSLNLQKYPSLIGGFQNEIALVHYHASHHARAPPVFS